MCCDAGYFYRRHDVICLLVLIVSLAKTVELIEMLFAMWTCRSK